MSSATPSRNHPMLRRLAAVLAAFTLLLTVGSAAGWSAINRLEGNITVDKGLSGLLKQSSETSSGSGTTYSAQNILIVGTDTRTGQGTGYGSAAATSSGNGQSDTTILLHISADRKSAFAVSIPRDSWVTRPGCASDGTLDGSTVTGKFNAAFSVGGRGCVIQAVKYLTGVTPDHFIEIDFKGFKAIVEALGGVTVCTTRRLYDPKFTNASGGHGSGLDLAVGTHTLNGDQALALVRARNLDPTADVGRMQRQQKFVSAVIRQATDTGLLTSPTKLYSVLSAVTSSLTVDAGLSGDALKSFLISLEGISPAKIVFFTVPFTARFDHENLLWKTADANVMWDAMKNDTPYPVTAGGAANVSAGPSQPVLTVHPYDIKVAVLNGSGISGLARKTADQLTALGYIVTSVGTANSSNNTTSTISYDTGWNESLKTLSWSAGSPTTTAVSGQGATFVLTVGKDWTAARAVKIAASVTASGGTVAADKTCLG
jgi:LCP family protein required for cell wall assembly